MSNRDPDRASEPCDLQLLLDSQLAQKLIGALAFPLELKFLDFDQSESSGTASDPTPEFDSDLAEAEDESHLEEVLDDVGLRPAMDGLRPREELAEVDDLVDTIAADAADPAETRLDSPAVDGAALDTCEDSVDASTAPQKLPGQKRSRIEVLGLALTIVSAPDVQVGNPVILSNLTVRVRTRLRVHVQLFGRWRSFPLRLPQMTFHGQQATLQLSAAGSIIYAEPALQALDLTASVNLFKKPMRLKLSISKFVNRQLAGREPLQVVDLGMMSRGLWIGAEQPEVRILALDNTPDGLMVKLNFELPENSSSVWDNGSSASGEASTAEVVEVVQE